MTTGTAIRRPVASVSLDLDNLWSYLKTHGDTTWTKLPTYLPIVVPRLLELFDAFGLRSTVFVVGQDTEADENAGPLASIAAAGHEIGNHSWSHEPWLHLYSRGQIEEELSRTEEALTRVTGYRPTGFRAPGYSMSGPLLDVLAERGYLYDASTLPTWVGPLARAYYFRSAKLTAKERARRRRLFGRARDGLLPLRPYRWGDGDGGVIEIPVTTLPVLRVPMHFSYVLYLHGKNPGIARWYFRSALATCRLRRVPPSLLLHPLDFLEDQEAPGVGFFPGMGQPAVEKLHVLTWCLRELTSRFEVVGARQYAEALCRQPLPRRSTRA